MTKSREEAIAAGIKVSDTRHSMNRRKSWHDYRRQGTYMLTFVVEGRQPQLGKLKTATEPADKSAGTVAAATVPAVSTAGEAARPSLFEGGYCDKLLMNEGQLDTWKHHLAGAMSEAQQAGRRDC